MKILLTTQNANALPNKLNDFTPFLSTKNPYKRIPLHNSVIISFPLSAMWIFPHTIQLSFPALTLNMNSLPWAIDVEIVPLPPNVGSYQCSI